MFIVPKEQRVKRRTTISSPFVVFLPSLIYQVIYQWTWERKNSSPPQPPAWEIFDNKLYALTAWGSLEILVYPLQVYLASLITVLAWRKPLTHVQRIFWNYKEMQSCECILWIIRFWGKIISAVERISFIITFIVTIDSYRGESTCDDNR